MKNELLSKCISEYDAQMRLRARAICGDRNIGDDIWHDAVIKIISSYDDKDVDYTNIKALFNKAILHAFIDRKRRSSNLDDASELNFKDEMFIDNPSVEKHLEIQDVIEYLNNFNIKYRNIFLLSIFGYDHRSISEMYSESYDNIRKITSRVRIELKRKFKHDKCK